MRRLGLRAMKELDLIEQICRSFAGNRNRSVRLGIGDDCAILGCEPGHEVVVTTDFTLEGRHFRRDLHPPESVGHRCLARGLSDIAAMGATPTTAFLSLAVPATLLANTAGRHWLAAGLGHLRLSGPGLPPWSDGSSGFTARVWHR